MTSKDLGIAIIGSGRIGSLRAILSAGHPAVKFLGVSDIKMENAKKLAERCNANKYTDNNHELISDPNVNAVIVSTSEHEHYDAVIHALELIENDGDVRYLNRITSVLALEIWYRIFIKKDLNPRKSL